MFSDIKIRTISALGLGLICLTCIYIGNFYLKFLLFSILIILNFEWMRIISQEQWIIRGLIASFFSTFILFTDSYTSFDLLLIISGAITIAAYSSFFKLSVFWSCFGFIYILLSINFFGYVRSLEEGLISVLLILSTIVISDISGYLFGKYLSGPKIFKKISPNKTYSGFFASLIIGVIWFSLLSILYSRHEPIIFILIGFFITIFSIMGDLFISYLKRKANLKESGFILPGPGGLFDRADSILPVFFVFLTISILTNLLNNPIQVILG